MTKIFFILEHHDIKRSEIIAKSWDFAVEEETLEHNGKTVLFGRGFVKQNLYRTVHGKNNPTVKTLLKLAICINSILSDRGDSTTYAIGDLIGTLESDEVIK